MYLCNEHKPQDMNTNQLTKEATTNDINSLDIVIGFTYNKWGTFIMGDGESFGNELNLKCDFFIYCEKIDNVFYTTFIPNPINVIDMSGWECQDWIDMYSTEVTYKTTYDDIRENLKDNNMVAVSRNNVFNITNFDFYYAGLLGNKIHEKVNLGKHSKYKELMSLLK